MSGKITRLALILAGPNGAGKSTLREVVLEDYSEFDRKYFIDVDELAKGYGGYNDENLKKAREVARALKERYLSESKSFGFETLLANPAHLSDIKRFQKEGCFVALYFITLDSREKCVERVNERAKEPDGHFVEPDRVRRYYDSSMKNFTEASQLSDSAIFFDNTPDYPDGIEPMFALKKGAPVFVNENITAFARSVLERIKLYRKEMDKTLLPLILIYK